MVKLELVQLPPKSPIFLSPRLKKEKFIWIKKLFLISEKDNSFDLSPFSSKINSQENFSAAHRYTPTRTGNGSSRVPGPLDGVRTGAQA